LVHLIAHARDALVHLHIRPLKGQLPLCRHAFRKPGERGFQLRPEVRGQPLHIERLAHFFNSAAQLGFRRRPLLEDLGLGLLRRRAPRTPGEREDLIELGLEPQDMLLGLRENASRGHVALGDNGWSEIL
jgi:hypothetical protein